MIPRDYIAGTRPHRTDDPWWLAGSCGKKEQVMSDHRIKPWFDKLHHLRVCGAEDALSNSSPPEEDFIRNALSAARHYSFKSSLNSPSCL